jgi:hypothetical protein
LALQHKARPVRKPDQPQAFALNMDLGIWRYLSQRDDARRIGEGVRDMISYETVFDSSMVPFKYGWGLGLLLVAAFSIWWGIRRLRNSDGGFFGLIRAFKSLALVITGFGIFVFIGHDWWTHQVVQTAAASGDGAEIIEGIVRDHQVGEQTVETKDDVRIDMVEHFRVSKVEFDFAQSRSEDRYFSNASDHRVKIYDGMRVRVTYIPTKKANKIVKLEIAQ